MKSQSPRVGSVRMRIRSKGPKKVPSVIIVKERKLRKESLLYDNNLGRQLNKYNKLFVKILTTAFKGIVK